MGGQIKKNLLAEVPFAYNLHCELIICNICYKLCQDGAGDKKNPPHLRGIFQFVMLSKFITDNFLLEVGTVGSRFNGVDVGETFAGLEEA